jgi:hypothetical protein
MPGCGQAKERLHGSQAVPDEHHALESPAEQPIEPAGHIQPALIDLLVGRTDEPLAGQAAT